MIIKLKEEELGNLIIQVEMKDGSLKVVKLGGAIAEKEPAKKVIPMTPQGGKSLSTFTSPRIPTAPLAYDMTGDEMSSDDDSEEYTLLEQRIMTATRRKRLTKNMRKAFEDKRIYVEEGGVAKEYPSPNTLYDESELFREWVETKITYALSIASTTSSQRVNIQTLTSFITSYDHPRYGWFTYASNAGKSVIPKSLEEETVSSVASPQQSDFV